MNDEIVVIDDIIPKKYQDDIFSIVINERFPYYFYRTTFNKINDDENNPSILSDKNDVGTFTHRFIRDGVNNSDYTEEIMKPFLLFKDRLDNALIGTSHKIDYNKISRLQVSLVLERKAKFKKLRTPWHVDMDQDHTTMVYYVADADGKICFENGDKVTPKKGRCVVFDGKMRHCIELSSTYRASINFNILR